MRENYSVKNFILNVISNYKKRKRKIESYRLIEYVYKCIFAFFASRYHRNTLMITRRVIYFSCIIFCLQ